MVKPTKEIEKEESDRNHNQRRNVAGGESYTVGNLGLNDYYSGLNYKRSCIQPGTPGGLEYIRPYT